MLIKRGHFRQIKVQGQGQRRAFRARLLSFLIPGLCCVISVPSAWAQGCVLCYTSAAAGGPSVMKALLWGVLTLLVPALLLFISVFLLILRRARSASQAVPHAAQSGVRPPSLRRTFFSRFRTAPLS